MVKMDLLDSMYDKFIDNSELTEEELFGIGFMSEELTELTEKGKIASVKRGVYRLMDVEGLFNHSYALPKERRYDVYKRCLEMDPKNTKYAVAVLNQSLWVRDFDATFKSFDTLDTPDSRKDQNLKLLLLSYITDLPEKYQERVRNLTIDDVTFDYSSIQMNTCIYDANFKIALAICNHYKKSITNAMLHRMLRLAEKRHKKNLELYCELVSNGNYEELLEGLSKEKEIHPLGVFERNALLIAQDIISMKESGHIREVDFSDTDDFDEAVRRGNYDLALKLSEAIVFSLNRPVLCELLEDALFYRKNLNERERLSENLEDRKTSELSSSTAEKSVTSEDALESAISLDSAFESTSSRPLSLQTVIDGIMAGDNLALLESMNYEDIFNVLREIGDNRNIISFVIGDGDKKQIALKYQGASNDLSIRETLQEAEIAYFGGEFDTCIHLYESLLPEFEEPQSFIYARLGRAYYNRAENDDWNNAIDYLTLATCQRENRTSFEGYRKLLDKLKASTGYNGIKVTLDSQKDSGAAIQYVKKDNKD